MLLELYLEQHRTEACMTWGVVPVFAVKATNANTTHNYCSKEERSCAISIQRYPAINQLLVLMPLHQRNGAKVKHTH